MFRRLSGVKTFKLLHESIDKYNIEVGSIMKVELLNEIIQYMMKRPYNEVFQIMDKVREAFKEAENKASVASSEEEGLDG